MVERLVANEKITGSNPVSRSIFLNLNLLCGWLLGTQGWRNWQTRTVQNRMPQGVRVRLPLPAPVFSFDEAEVVELADTQS